MGKKANCKKNLRFATVAIDGREWDFEVPPYLCGRLKRGSLVAIRRDGWYGVGEVVCLRASTPHSSENVRLIVDRVKEGRWERVSDRKAEARDLMSPASTSWQSSPSAIPSSRGSWRCSPSRPTIQHSPRPRTPPNPGG